MYKVTSLKQLNKLCSLHWFSIINYTFYCDRHLFGSLLESTNEIIKTDERELVTLIITFVFTVKVQTLSYYIKPQLLQAMIQLNRVRSTWKIFQDCCFSNFNSLHLIFYHLYVIFKCNCSYEVWEYHSHVSFHSVNF